MARHLFSGSLDAWTFDLGDAALAGSGASGFLAIVVPTVECMFWDSPILGTQYTDLTDLGGSPIESITSDSDGEIGQFYGPDNIRAMWIDASGGAGPRRQIVAVDLGDDIAANSAAIANLQNTVDNLVALTAGMAMFVLANLDNSWPDRPALAGARLVFWVGTTSPTYGGTDPVGMAPGDIFLKKP
jgi:hypothetical protein